MISKRILGLLILIFIASIFYAYFKTPKQERVDNRDERRLPVSSSSSKPSADEEVFPRLRVDLLERKPQAYPGVRRNLFSSHISVVQKDEEESEEITSEPPAVELPPVVTPVIAPPVPPPPTLRDVARQELSQYKFIGFVKKREKKTLFLSSGGEVFLLRVGDVLGRDRKYVVKNITDTSLELQREGLGEISIKLTDQESLSTFSIQEQRGQEGGPSPSPPEQEINMQNQPLPDMQSVPDEESNTGEQFKPDEDN